MRKTGGKQAIAALLAALMLVGNLSVPLAKAAPATPVTSPAVEIQGNAVRRFGQLTGFFELSLRVQTPAAETFRDLAVALEYDPKVLQPVTWDALPDAATGAVPTINITNAPNYSAQLPVKKADSITGGTALSGQAQTAGPGTVGKSLLFFHAESMKNVDLSTGMTTLAVLRFYVNPTTPITYATDGVTLMFGGKAAAIADFVTLTPPAALTGAPTSAQVTYSSGSGEVAGIAPKFTLVSKDSSGMIDMDADKLCVITYLDWDDSVLGTQIVPRNTDVRQLVNDHVKTSYIHSELQASTKYSSLARTDSYRGKYPHSGPGGTGVVTDGENFPLTNKLDYTFLKRVMVKNTANTEWVPDLTPYDAAYPYIHGWASVASTGGETWTTLGVGELAGYTPGKLPISAENAYFALQDFTKLTQPQITVKAVYEPGELLKANDAYVITGEPQISRYGYTASTENATYAIKYRYERINVGKCGVGRVRQPVVKQGTKPDALSMDGKNAKSEFMYMEVAAANKDVIDVQLTPAGSVWDVNYALVDIYGTNFVLAPTRSEVGNSMKIPTNFNYENFKYSTRQGSDGLVLQATLKTLFAEAEKAAAGQANEFSFHWKAATIQDLNFRSDIAGTEVSIGNLTEMGTKFRAAVAANKTGKDLTWHQLQYHLIHAAPDGSGGIIGAGGALKTDAECKTAEQYNWCRLLDGCVVGSVVTVEKLEDLLNIVKDNDTTSIDLMGLDLVNNAPLYLRKDLSAGSFTDKAALITSLKTLVTAAGGGYAALTWDQVQYFLIHGGSTVPDAAAAKTESDGSYFWKAGGAPVADWQSFLAAVNGARNDAPAALNMVTPAMATGAPLYLRKDAMGAAFTDWTEFRTKVKTAVGFAGVDYTGITWEQMQHFIFVGGMALPTNSVAKTEADKSYWWESGGEKVTDLPSLLAAAKLANLADPDFNPATETLNNGTLAALATLKAQSSLTDGTEKLRADFAGTPFADVAAFAMEIRGVVRFDGGALSWQLVQFLLIRVAPDGTLPNGYTVASEYGRNTEAAYYWWRSADLPPAVTLTDRDVPSLIKAVFLGSQNGNGGAWTDMQNNAANVFTKFRLIDTYNGSAETIPALGQYADLAAFQTEMAGLIAAAMTAQNLGLATYYDMPQTINWFQTQHYLLTGIYLDYAHPSLPDANTYWWQADAPAKSSVAPMVLALQDYATGVNGDANVLKNVLTTAALNGTFFIKRTSTGLSYAKTPPPTAKNQLNAAKTAYLALGDELKTAITAGTCPYYKENKLQLSWYQVQYYMASDVADELLSHDAAKAAIEGAAPTGWGWTTADYIPAGADLGGIVGLRAPLGRALHVAPQAPPETVLNPDGSSTVTKTATTTDPLANTVTAMTTATTTGLPVLRQTVRETAAADEPALRITEEISEVTITETITKTVIHMTSGAVSATSKTTVTQRETLREISREPIVPVQPSPSPSPSPSTPPDPAATPSPSPSPSTPPDPAATPSPSPSPSLTPDPAVTPSPSPNPSTPPDPAATPSPSPSPGTPPDPAVTPDPEPKPTPTAGPSPAGTLAAFSARRLTRQGQNRPLPLPPWRLYQVFPTALGSAWRGVTPHKTPPFWRQASILGRGSPVFAYKINFKTQLGGN